MQWKMLLNGAVGAASLVISFSSSAYDVTTFDPNAFFTTGSAPLPGEVDALDAAAGITGFDIERFEDLTLEPGLTIEASGAAPTSVLPGGSLISEPEATWDGTLSLSALMDLVPNQPIVIRHSPGVDAISIGISGFDHSHELVVNGQNLGAVDSFPNYQPSPGDNGRSIYIRVDREAGDPVITEMAFLPDPQLANPNGDFVRIDHLATGLLPPVPSLSAPLLLVLVALLSLVAALRLRHQTH